MLRSNLLRLGILSFLALSQLLPVIAEDKLGRAVELYESKKYSEAEAALREVLAEEAGNSRARHTLGLALLALKNYGEAANELQKAVEAGGASDTLQVDLARAYVELKEWDKAEAALESSRRNQVRQSGYLLLSRNGRRRRAKITPPRSRGSRRRSNSTPPTPTRTTMPDSLITPSERSDKTVQHLAIFLKLAPDAPEAKKVESLLRSLR